MNWGIVKERKTFYRVTTAYGDSLVYNNKDDAEARLEKEMKTARVKVGLAQQGVRNAHRHCSNMMRKYKDFLVNKGAELEIRPFSSTQATIAWIGWDDTYFVSVQHNADFLRMMSKSMLRGYVRCHLKWELKKCIKVLKEEKKRYYESVKFSKMARDYILGKEDKK